MRETLHNKQGFTLTELIVTIVVAGIAMAMIGMLLTSIYRDWKKSNENSERINDQTIIMECLDDLVNECNLGKIDNIKLSENKIYYEDNRILFNYDTTNKKIQYKDKYYEMLRIKNIGIVKVTETTNKIIKVTITFDNDTTKEATYCFIKSIN